MPNVFERHAQGVEAVQNYHGDNCPTFTWAGETYKLLPGSAIRRSKMGTGGFQLDCDLQFCALAAQFGENVPSDGAVIQYADTEWRIAEVHHFPGGQLLRFTCNHRHQGV